MAFGFTRAPGASRRYVSEAGVSISRRQYDKLVAAQTPGKVIHAGARISKGAMLTAARDAAEARVRAIQGRVKPTGRVYRKALREQEASRAAHGAHWIAQRGQRGMNAALDLYVRRERQRGSRASRRDLRASPEFKEILKGLKPEKARKRESPDARRARERRNARRREETFKLLGDRSGDEFREQYAQNLLSVDDDELEEVE